MAASTQATRDVVVDAGAIPATRNENEDHRDMFVNAARTSSLSWE